MKTPPGDNMNLMKTLTDVEAHPDADELFAQTVAAITEETGNPPTHFQIAIYKWALHDTGHAVVDAKAGSGKTTTIVDMLRFIPCLNKVVLVAFNKHIAEELNGRGLPSNATAKTLHSVGLSAFRRHQNRCKVSSNKTRYILADLMGGFNLMDDEEKKTYYKLAAPMQRMVSLFKNFGYGALLPYPTKDEVLELAAKYSVELPDEMDTFLKMLAETFKKSIEQLNTIDFDDMLYLPIKLNLDFQHSDLVMVDESQDLNPIQIEIVKRMIGERGRALFCGDPHQAIYGFRGADPEAIQSIYDAFGATKLPLSISWRCPTAVIKEAQMLVPDIEASPYAKPGIVRSANLDTFRTEVESGDYVLSRTTAPLVQECLKAIRTGKKAMVRGRDIGKGLLHMADNIEKQCGNADVLDAIEGYSEVETAKYAKPYQAAQLMVLTDKLDTLTVLACECSTFAEVKAAINKIFSDSDEGIVFSTIHRAKGLEAKRIFLFMAKLPHPLAQQEWQIQQEENLKYVAITRAMEELVKVDNSKNQ
jgi:DNA helicase-2/ATP-dependent DNA helicase PcrA